MTAFQNQRILLTGGGTGIGRALIHALQGRNNRWLIAGRNEATLKEAAGGVDYVHTSVADVSQDADRKRLIAEAREKMGGLDVLINNAGVQFYPRFDQGTELENLASEVDINLTAPIALAAEAIPVLKDGRTPMIINVSSTLAIAPKASAPVYCATKAGLASFSRALRYQLEKPGIRVVTVYPPLVSTPMTAGRNKGAMSPEKFARAVVRGVDQGKDELLIGGSKLLARVMRISPGLAYRVVKGVPGRAD